MLKIHHLTKNTMTASMALTVVVSLLPIVALAQVTDFCTGVIQPLFRAIRIFGTIVLVAAVVIILWSAFLFITASGNEDSLKKAKTYLVFAFIGIAVALLATSAEPIVKNILPGSQLISECSRNI